MTYSDNAILDLKNLHICHLFDFRILSDSKIEFTPYKTDI